MNKLDDEQKRMVRDLIYHYCEVQKEMNKECSSAINVCLRSHCIDIIKVEKALGLLSDDE